MRPIRQSCPYHGLIRPSCAGQRCACVLRVKEMSTYIVRYVRGHPVICNCASTAFTTARHHHRHSVVLANSTIDHDDGKRQARQLTLHFLCLLQERRRYVLVVVEWS